LRGICKKARHTRLRVAGAAALAVALGACVASCGGGSSADSNQPAGVYRMQVVTAKFPTSQLLGQASLLRIGVRNTGVKTVPALAVTASIAGRAGRTSALPFGIHDPQPGLSQPDRPVWVMGENYPRLAGATQRAGALTASPKTFDFGPLKPGATTEAVWKLTASKAGDYVLLYKVDAGLSGTARAVTAAGTRPGGSFAVRISSVPPNTIVNGKGQVVIIHGSGAGR
jgi:hypothetical protein